MPLKVEEKIAMLDPARRRKVEDRAARAHCRGDESAPASQSTAAHPGARRGPTGDLAGWRLPARATKRSVALDVAQDGGGHGRQPVAHRQIPGSSTSRIVQASPREALQRRLRRPSPMADVRELNAGSGPGGDRARQARTGNGRKPAARIRGGRSLRQRDGRSKSVKTVAFFNNRGRGGHDFSRLPSGVDVRRSGPKGNCGRP